MSLYFKKQNQQSKTGLSTLRLADELVPREAPIDVIKKFPWTLTPPSSPALDETPYIKLKEYYILEGALNQLLLAYNQYIDPTSTTGTLLDTGSILLNPNSLIGQGVDSTRVYEGLYNLDNPSGFEYIMPYFENPTNIQNNWTAKSSYEAMLQLQRVLAQVEATIAYYNVNPAAATAALSQGYGNVFTTGATLQEQTDRWLNDMTNLLGGDTPTGNMFSPLAIEAAAKGLERTPVLGGEWWQRARQAMIDLNIFQVDLDRTMEQINIALKSATGNIGQDPVLDKPHIWNSSQPRVFNITFPLYNINATEQNDWEKSLTRNWQLCYALTYQNLYNKRNLFTGLPPVFYEVEVPGVYYTKAAYVNNLTILNIGNIRQMRLPVGENNSTITVNMPDAYVVNMSIVDFFMPSRNFLDTINNPSRRNTIRKPS